MASYPQFGYSYHAPSPSSQGMVGSGGGGGGESAPGSPGTSPAPCCEGGRPVLTDPTSGQTVCSCQYDPTRLALPYRAPPPVYSTHYPSTDQNPYPSIDSSPFYSPLSNPYGLKESTTASEMNPWAGGIQPSSGYYPYDPALAAYGYGAGYDLAARRKNATRESTATLKAWLNEHKKNPYPTKGEKIMLAIITKMTLTQVSTWFANARRRLKKENKMTWEPKNKTEEEDDAVLSDCDDKNEHSNDKMREPVMHVKAEQRLGDEGEEEEERKGLVGGSRDCGVPLPATKPKIWSLADTAACKTPPPSWQWGRYPGWPEVQADTPPQTPPGGKLYGAAPSQYPSQPYYRPPDPQDPLQPDDAAFKPFYKSQSQMNGGYVSPV